MMGFIHSAKTFRQSLNYCLLDKKLSLAEGGSPGEVRFRDRAEILYFNQCFGNRETLIRQFNEVGHLRPNMSKAVFHLSISFPPGERLAKSTLVDISVDCARAFEFERHQFVTILHKDTVQQHIHIVANRIGFDRHVADDSYSYGRMADYCREGELRFHLTRELGPRRYQSPEQRLTPRQGLRLDKLKQTITHALTLATDYPAFETTMKLNGYAVHRSERGIAFSEDRKVFIKGSEAGYPWKTIRLALEQKLELRQEQHLRQKQHLRQEPELQRKHQLRLTL
jgi:hypothetical protein